MASEIRVNTFKNRSGLGTITVNDNGANFSGVVTAASFSGNLTGDVIGNVTGNVTGDVTGNATGLSGSPTLSGITSVSTTNLTVNGNRYPSTGPLSNRNLIINGAMQVAQRGTSVTGVSDGSDEGYNTLDRFAINFSFSPSGACTISQDTDVPSNEGFSNSYKLDVTTANGSIGSTQRILIEYKVEAQDLRNSGWNFTSASDDITLSFWAKSSKAGTYCLTARATDVGHKYYVFEYTLAANTWKKITHSIPGDSSLVFNNDNGNGLELQWVLAAGADRNDATADQWNAISANNAATSNQVNCFDSTDNDFYLTGVQLEVGSFATPFEHRSYGDELARCQRYFYRLSGTRLVGGYKRHDAEVNFRVTTPVPMRQLPSASLPTTGNFTNFQSSLGATQSSPNTYEFNTGSNDCFIFSVQSTWSSTHAFVPSYEAFVANFDAEL